jgi:hypothetical protein
MGTLLGHAIRLMGLAAGGLAIGAAWKTYRHLANQRKLEEGRDIRRTVEFRKKDLWDCLLGSELSRAALAVTAEKPIRVRKKGENYACKICQCAECGIISQCRPGFDFYVEADDMDSEEAPLCCRRCLLVRAEKRKRANSQQSQSISSRSPYLH